MRIPITRPLFAWDCLEDSPSLRTVRDFLHALPDAELLRALRESRGRGRDDYPVTALWGVCVLTPLLRHITVEATLAELRRNDGLRRRIGIDSEHGVPKKWNVSRFQKVLGTEPHLSLLREVFDVMVQRLGGAVPQFGRRTAGDATALSARTQRSRDGGEDLDPPTGGKKEYLDDEGKVTKILQWFGYKLHLRVDVDHEVALAYQVSSANRGDNELLPALVEQARRNLGDDLEADPPVRRIETLAYDKAADTEAVHELLDGCDRKPLVEIRSLWKGEQERMLPGHDGNSNVVYDEAGTLYCYDKVSDPPVRREMAYIGHEASRGTLKYRCPARHYGFKCPSDARCNAGKKYGKTVRVKREIDLRRFPPIPRATKTFEREYKGRTAVERVNARTKIFWGIDDGNVTGAERFHANVGVVMLVHVGLATLLAACPRWEGTLGQTRLSPIAEALGAKIAG
ncbi:MAG TPA: transposase [Phycisphaerae bacterium]|nr:transposase [Phycisphaerae bacterium]